MGRYWPLIVMGLVIAMSLGYCEAHKQDQQNQLPSCFVVEAGEACQYP